MKKNNKITLLNRLFYLLPMTLIPLLYGEQNRTRPIFPPSLTYETSYLGTGDIGGGDVRVIKNQLQLNKDFFTFGYTNWKFDWENVASLPFGDRINNPIDQAHSLQASIRYRQKNDDQWSYMTLLSLKSTFEKELDNSFGVNLLGYSSYHIGDGHSFQMGGFVNYHPIRTLLLPALSYSYRERAKDGWQVILGFPRTYLGYHLNEQFMLKTGVMFSQSLVRLSNASIIENGGYIEAKDYLSNIGFTYALNPSLSLSADLLYTLKREFTIFDSNANEKQKNSVGNAIGANMSLNYRF